MEEAVGDTEMETRLAAAVATLRVAVPCRPPDCALIVAVPTLEPMATPGALMLAMAESEEVHCAVAVISLELPSEK